MYPIYFNRTFNNDIMISMKIKNIFQTFLLVTSLFLFTTPILAQSTPDFKINTYTKIFYTTGQDFVTVTNEYERLVENSSFYFTKEGEKVFHIPDVSSIEEEVLKERDFKKNSLKVTDTKNNSVNFTVEELNMGEGMYIHIPFYRTTTKSLPYKIVLTYNTHDNVIKSGKLITLMASSLPIDTVFQKNDEKNKTTTEFNYNLSIIVDEKIPLLAKAYPRFSKEEKEGLVYYNFLAEDRINKPPTLEFGTSVVYKFELEYQTPKTDSLIPPKYSKLLKALSTNIFEISLPREFAETSQKVVIEEISPLPQKIYRDEEGNVLAIFEIPANKDDKIKITGYISSSQSEYNTSLKEPLNIDFKEYLEKIGKDNTNKRYLNPTKYWQINDPFIQETAQSLISDDGTLEDVINSTYQYINDTLTYDNNKANSENERIGAVSALTGGASVCMEYADSMIALLRAQGIPSRAAFGYTEITDTPKELIRHQWVQIWVPEFGWISIDPTYESNNRKIGQLIERVLWETFNDDSISNIYVYSVNNLDNFDEKSFSIKLSSIEDIPDIEQKTYSDILPGVGIKESDKYTIGNWTNTFLKTTVLGRALLVSLPILVTLFVTITILVSIKLVKAKTSKTKISQKKELINKSIGRFTT